MTFTYNLASTDGDTLNIAKVRLELGDTTSGSGVRPDGSNLGDEEIAVWLDREADDVMRATAAACEALSRQWATIADITVGPRREALGKVAERYAERAEQLREQYGGLTKVFTAGFNRQDGYHDQRILSDYTTDEYGGEQN